MLSINDVEISIDWELGEALVFCNCEGRQEDLMVSITEGDIDVIGDQAVYLVLLGDKQIDSSFNILEHGHSYMSRKEKEEIIKQEIIGLLNEYYEYIE
ncbi:hypothetical protein O3802_03305 [Gemella sp. 27098_8_92]|uniref:hypothetical protein n=1 Tax=Gemella sp. 27098_8_92 TaxID=3003687 RepID=UPI00352F00CF